MLRGMQQRAAIAITLMAVMLLAVGTCVAPAQPPTHSCCMHMSAPCGNKADCCKASPQVPEATVTPVFSGFAAMDAGEDFFTAGDNPMWPAAAIAAVLPSQSSPPGIFNLRI